MWADMSAATPLGARGGSVIGGVVQAVIEGKLNGVVAYHTNTMPL